LNEGYKCYEDDILDKEVDEDQSADTSFDNIARKMVDITADGGVKKQTIDQGIGDVIPPDANVLSNSLFLCTYVNSDTNLL